jgi:hypothetical protein
VNRYRRAPILLLIVFASCAQRPPPPQLRPDQAIVVLPANNRTGDALLVSGGSLIDRYALHSGEVTVGDVLAAEARFQLGERGLRVASHEAVASATQGRVPHSVAAAADIAKGKLEGLVLYLEIRHWEPDAPIHPSFVIVGISASLVDPDSGEVVWQLDRRSAPVATPGEVTLESAYETAARKVIAEIASALVPKARAPRRSARARAGPRWSRSGSPASWRA